MACLPGISLVSAYRDLPGMAGPLWGSRALEGRFWASEPISPYRALSTGCTGIPIGMVGIRISLSPIGMVGIVVRIPSSPIGMPRARGSAIPTSPIGMVGIQFLLLR
jgi:hypothetical protein